jgi:AbrB family looped-hinge helix DNA binding protein
MIATFSTRGRLVIPKAMRDTLGIVAGTRYEVVNRPDGVLIRIVRTDTPAFTQPAFTQLTATQLTAIQVTYP